MLGLSSIGDQTIANRIGGGQDHGARSITMRSGPFSINRRRAINTNKMIHAGPTRSTRDREISAQSWFGVYEVFRIYHVIFQPYFVSL